MELTGAGSGGGVTGRAGGARAGQTAVIEGFLPANHGNARMHHFAKYRALQHERNYAWAAALRGHWHRMFCKAHLSIVLVIPSRRYLSDADNAVARCKGLIDGLKQWIVDDSTDWLELDVSQRVEKGRRAVELTLSEVEP